MALAESLGWPFEVKRLRYRWSETLVRLASLPSLLGVDPASRSALASPYPELIIAAGRGSEAVSFWLRRHGNPAARLVYVGTPWSVPDRFDLVIATPQYRLPEHPNVLHIGLPLHGIDSGKLAEAASAWSARLAHLPRPLTAVLVGGSSGPYVFTPTAGERLGMAANSLAAKSGGSLLVSTSARTPQAVTDAIVKTLSVPHHVHRVTSGNGDNPFLAYLALASQIIVTADSISMISEACASGKSVLLFDIEEGHRSMRAEEALAQATGKLPPPHWLGLDLSSTLFRLAMRFAPPRWSRDLRIVHRNVTMSGNASWLDEPQAAAKPVQPDLARAADRVRKLFEM
jgi:mitochondrial fission protein ELM1